MDTLSWYDGRRDALRPLFELADDSPAALDRYIDRGRVLVARNAGGDVIGHLQLIETDDPLVQEIKNVAVAEEEQGRGLGRRLVECAIASCRNEGGRSISVVTAMADIGNLRFYQRCGFRAVRVVRDAFTAAEGYPPDIVVDGIPLLDAIRFEYELAPS